jgi:hypothetical protein
MPMGNNATRYVPCMVSVVYSLHNYDTIMIYKHTVTELNLLLPFHEPQLKHALGFRIFGPRLIP